MTGRPPWRPLLSSRKVQPRATSSQEPQASCLSPGALAPRGSPFHLQEPGRPRSSGWGLGAWPVVAGPGPEKLRLLVECGESWRAEAPCASVNSEATLGIEREQAGAHPLLCRFVPLRAPGTSSVPSPSGPRAHCQFWFSPGPWRVVGSVPLRAPSASLVLIRSHPRRCRRFWFPPGPRGCCLPSLVSSRAAWLDAPQRGHGRGTSLHSAGSGRAASVQGRPPGAPLPRLSGQLPDRTVP